MLHFDTFENRRPLAPRSIADLKLKAELELLGVIAGRCAHWVLVSHAVSMLRKDVPEETSPQGFATHTGL